MTTLEDRNTIREACKQYMELQNDGTHLLPSLFTEDQVYGLIIDRFDEFENFVLKESVLRDKNYATVTEAFEKDSVLFVYILQSFFILHNYTGLTSVDELGNLDVPADDTTNIKAEIHIDDKENKKQLVKEVMDAINRKQSLNDFLNDINSYKQFRDDIDLCLLYEIDFEKIHEVMEVLDWEWASWMDEEYNEHENSIPSAFGIKENLVKKLKNMEEWIRNNPDAKEYNMSCGGWEINMHMVEDLETEDDYESQVRFSVKFVAEYFDNGM